MTTVKEAITKATAFLNEIVGAQPTTNMMVEEVERDKLGDWIITLGYEVPVKEEALALFGGAALKRRVYKVFKVNAQSGEVVSMKIREVAAIE